MKVLLLLTVIAVATRVSASKLKRSSKGDDSDDDQSPEDEAFPDPKAIFDLTGTVRRNFALEAALIDPDQNIICSPISALLPLGKLALGTEKGKSRDELLAAMGSTRLTVQQNIRDLMKASGYVPEVILTVVSRIFVAQTLKMSRSYMKSIQPLFGSDAVQKLDFDKPDDSAKKVNGWVSEHTNGMIQNMISPEDITPQTSILLVNAVYFSGLWKYPFKSVSKGSFHTPQGLKSLALMNAQNHYSYHQSRDLSAKLLQIPYGSDNASFVIVLPLLTSDLPHLINKLKANPDLLNIEMAKMTTKQVAVTLPKFEIESELDLKSLYEKLGVKEIFTEKSGLTKIADTPISVSKAVQKAVIEVSEKGTKAAASSVVHVAMATLYDDVTYFTADHPFLFYVKVGGQQLFAGIFNGV